MRGVAVCVLSIGADDPAGSRPRSARVVAVAGGRPDIRGAFDALVAGFVTREAREQSSELMSPIHLWWLLADAALAFPSILADRRLVGHPLAETEPANLRR